MQPMTEGINLDPQVLIAVQSERIAASAMREAQLTAAVQQLTMENMQLTEQLQVARQAVYDVEVTDQPEDEDASADDGG